MQPRLAIKLNSLRQLSRHIHSTSRLRASALQNLFDADDRPSLFIEKLNEKGFYLSDHLVVPGGLIIVDGRPLLWNVDPPRDYDAKGGIEGIWRGWAKERFSVFETVVPRPGKALIALEGLFHGLRTVQRYSSLERGRECSLCQRQYGITSVAWEYSSTSWIL